MTYCVSKQDILAGLQAEPCHCPVALAIKRRHRTQEVYVHSHEVVIAWRSHVLPERVKEFISSFDRGEPVNPIRFEL